MPPPPLVSHGDNLFNLCPFPVQNLLPIGPPVWPHFPGFWIVDPLKPPKMPLWGLVGRIVFSLCPFQDESTYVYRIWCQSGIKLCPFPDESADMYQIWCQSVEQFDSFPRHLNLWPPKNTKMPPGVLWGDWYLAYVYSRMNPQTWTKVGANRPSRLTASPDVWMFDPLKPPSAPWCLEGQFLWRISIPRWICRREPNLVPIGPAVWQLQQTFEFVTP